WSIVSFINPVTGELAIDVSSAMPITAAIGGSLVTIEFHVRAGAALGPTPIQLVDTVNPTGRHAFTTEVSDALGAYVLNPAPAHGDNQGGIAGSIIVQGNLNRLADQADRVRMLFV